MSEHGDWRRKQDDALEIVRVGMVEFNELLKSVRKDGIHVKVNGCDLVTITSIDRLTEEETKGHTS